MVEASLTDEEREELLGLVEEYIMAPRGREGAAVWSELIGYIAWLKKQKTGIGTVRLRRSRRGRPT